MTEPRIDLYLLLVLATKVAFTLEQNEYLLRILKKNSKIKQGKHTITDLKQEIKALIFKDLFA